MLGPVTVSAVAAAVVLVALVVGAVLVAVKAFAGCVFVVVT